MEVKASMQIFLPAEVGDKPKLLAKGLEEAISTFCDPGKLTGSFCVAGEVPKAWEKVATPILADAFCFKELCFSARVLGCTLEVAMGAPVTVGGFCAAEKAARTIAGGRDLCGPSSGCLGLERAPWIF
ncbi:hypothetical protein CIPAW_02G012200 [Carya illinoinensis]|uniref:Uncharacterized protein n=1 Tax=Carya illinoinensis TaxID=32201 RepID=A0A8T1R8K6_CARIL|nr:hypothetical protein CIPAW_02G012200 [Carya illinoinensis]